VSQLDELKRGVFASSLSDQDREHSREDLMKFLKDKLDKYFNYLDSQLQFSSNLSNAAFNQCVEILNILRIDVGKCIVLSNLAGIDTRMSTLTVTVLDRIIHGVFGKVSHDFFKNVNSLTNASDAQVFNTVRQMTNWIKETLIAKALPALEV
jgi:hypothetical protein